jgi:hypothetical protein
MSGSALTPSKFVSGKTVRAIQRYSADRGYLGTPVHYSTMALTSGTMALIDHHTMTPAGYPVTLVTIYSADWTVQELRKFEWK